MSSEVKDILSVHSLHVWIRACTSPKIAHASVRCPGWLSILSSHDGVLIFFKSANLSLNCLGSMEKAMAPHSNTPAWKIPGMEEPSRLQSRGSLRVGHDWVTSLSLFTFMHWRRKWQPTPVFLPGEFQGWGSLVGCCLWGHTELDTTEVT